MNLNEIDKSKPIHMIGIGGISMSGIAEIVKNMGFLVTGSDISLSKITENLSMTGIKIYEGHIPEAVENASLVVYSAAIKEDNPELERARELSIPTIERADFLGEITKLYPETISISGTHGKTTTTSMIALSFIEDGKDPTVQVGAVLKEINGNYRIGNSPYFIIEACEYVESFLKFHTNTAVLLNIEEDHLDYYKDLEHIKSSFKKFVDAVPEEGFVIVNGDSDDCLDVINDVKANIILFGIENEKSNWIASDIVLNKDGYYSFIAVNKQDNIKVPIKLTILGYHNIYNALATVATSYAHKIRVDSISKSLNLYRGASRRFEYVGEFNGAKIYDDYAHHPTEIKSTIESALLLPHNKLWVIFQPHTYSRTKALFDSFTKAFMNVDILILTDIYASREKYTSEVNSETLAISINEVSNNCYYISKFEDIVKYVKENAVKDDLILTIGAGDITDIGYMIIK